MMLSHYSLIIFALMALLLISSVTGQNKRQQSTVTAEQKLDQIIDLAAKSKNNVITLDDATYAYYATTKPSPYSLIIFLTAAHPKFRCAICKQLDKEFQLLASTYAAAMKERKETPSTFFIRLDYESSNKIFTNYQVNSVPVIFHSPPRITDKSATGGENALYQIPLREKYQMPADPDAEGLATFLRERTGVSLQIKRSAFWVYVTLVVAFMGLAALVAPVIAALPTIIRIVQLKPIWQLACAGIYTCAISGLIFDIIRSPPMYYANPQSGQIMFFYPQSGSQFVVEGFIIGFLNMACAGAVIFLGTLAPKIKTAEGRTTAVMAAMTVFVVCFWQIRNLYRMKNRWYGMSM